MKNHYRLPMLVSLLLLTISAQEASAFYNPQTGRWLSRDPIGERGGKNLYAFVQNDSQHFVDPTGLYLKSFPPGVGFWTKWTQKQRDSWVDDFKKKLGPSIDRAANALCVPKELLSTIIAMEMIAYSRGEYIGERLGFGDSMGPAQITADTVIREGLYDIWPNPYAEQWYPGEAAPWAGFQKWPDPTVIRQYLVDADTNIGVAARLLKIYLSKLCAAASSGTMTSSFRRDVASGCNLSDFCCRDGKRCKDIVNYNAPKCLVQALSSMWNNGPKLTEVDDIPHEAPRAYRFGRWASKLDGVFNP